MSPTRHSPSFPFLFPWRRGERPSPLGHRDGQSLGAFLLPELRGDDLLGTYTRRALNGQPRPLPFCTRAGRGRAVVLSPADKGGAAGRGEAEKQGGRAEGTGRTRGNALISTPS